MATTKYSYIEINTLLYQVLKPPKVENMKVTFSLIPNPHFPSPKTTAVICLLPVILEIFYAFTIRWIDFNNDR